MASSNNDKNFVQDFRAGNFQRALTNALSQAIELKITTWVSSGDTLDWADPTKAKPRPGHRMRTRINIVDGDIDNEIGKEFIDGTYDELRDFHMKQVERGLDIIHDNLQSVQKLFQVLGEVVRGRIEQAAAPQPIMQVQSSQDGALMAAQTTFGVATPDTIPTAIAPATYPTDYPMDYPTDAATSYPVMDEPAMMDVNMAAASDVAMPTFTPGSEGDLSVLDDVLADPSMSANGLVNTTTEDLPPPLMTEEEFLASTDIPIEATPNVTPFTPGDGDLSALDDLLANPDVPLAPDAVPSTPPSTDVPPTLGYVEPEYNADIDAVDDSVALPEEVLRTIGFQFLADGTPDSFPDLPVDDDIPSPEDVLASIEASSGQAATPPPTPDISDDDLIGDMLWVDTSTPTSGESDISTEVTETALTDFQSMLDDLGEFDAPAEEEAVPTSEQLEELHSEELVDLPVVDLVDDLADANVGATEPDQFEETIDLSTIHFDDASMEEALFGESADTTPEPSAIPEESTSTDGLFDDPFANSDESTSSATPSMDATLDDPWEELQPDTVSEESLLDQLNALDANLIDLSDPLGLETSELKPEELADDLFGTGESQIDDLLSSTLDLGEDDSNPEDLLSFLEAQDDSSEQP
jgi:hypothetical protein